MRFILWSILFFLGFKCYSQNYIDLVKLEYTATPQNIFDSINRHAPLAKAVVNLTVPIKLSNKLVLITGGTWNRITTKLGPNEKKTSLSAYLLKVGVNIKHNEYWSSTYLVLPKLASDFQGDLSRKDIHLGILGLAKKTKNENLTYKFGLYANSDRFGPFVVPLMGIYYKKNKVEADILLPSYSMISYEAMPHFRVGVNWRATVKSYNLHQQQYAPFSYVQHQSNEIALMAAYEIKKGLIIRGFTGRSVARSFRVYRDADKIDLGISAFSIGKNRTPLNFDFANGLFARVELIYRYYL